MHQKELIFTFDTYKKGVIDIYDLTSTIEAFGKTIETISGLQRYTKEIKLVIEVQALKPTSFEVKGNMWVVLALPARRFAAPRLSFLALEPERMNLSLCSSMRR